MQTNELGLIITKHRKNTIVHLFHRIYWTSHLSVVMRLMHDWTWSCFFYRFRTFLWFFKAYTPWCAWVLFLTTCRKRSWFVNFFLQRISIFVELSTTPWHIIVFSWEMYLRSWWTQSLMLVSSMHSGSKFQIYKQPN